MRLKILLLLSTFALGVFLGTQIAEAALILPYWKSLPAEAFFQFYKTHGEALHHFYAPLTIVAAILPLATFSVNWAAKSRTDFLMWLMMIFVLLFLATFFVYFKEANNRFLERSISDTALAEELVLWGKWHWARVFCEAVAFSVALILLWRTK